MLDKTFIQENADRLIFALDTGTRSVVGALGLWEDDIFTVIDYEQCPHKTRAMRDGQIEDIGQVARAIQSVKNALEQRWDVTLKKVSIAAAGRALKTVAAEFDQNIPTDDPITAEQIRSIEYGAVSSALDAFCQNDGGDHNFDGRSDSGDHNFDGRPDGGDDYFDGRSDGGDHNFDGRPDGGDDHFDGRPDGGGDSNFDGRPDGGDHHDFSGRPDGGDNNFDGRPDGGDDNFDGRKISIQPGDFSCVGYSVSGYWLDDYPISNLEGHRGKHMKTKVIAAFLPQSVVRSLYAATNQCELQVSSLTLEPIAAIHAIVPGDLRLLNLAIVDIGAGTSDIAVTRNGSVVAYDMVTLAGDEITEALMRRCLTDFDTAEQIKLSLCKSGSQESASPADTTGSQESASPTDTTSSPESASPADATSSPESASPADTTSDRELIFFTDILGNACSIEVGEAMEVIEPATEALCRGITDCITRINGASPAAVFLIGGGSQLGGMTCRIASGLELPKNRVALGGTRPYSHIRVCSEQLLSPEFVTPLGIGAISTLVPENDYLSVQINQQKVMIPGTGSLKILDALLLAGIRSSSLMGRTPPSLVFYKNNQPQTFRSTPSLPGELYCNGVPATLNTQIKQGDQITLIPAENGVAPQVCLADICDFEENVICTVNGLPGAPDYLLCPRDDVRIFSPKSPSKEADPTSQPSHTVQLSAGGSEAVKLSADDPEAVKLFADGSEAVKLSAGGSEAVKLSADGSEAVKLSAGGSEAVKLSAGGSETVKLSAGGSEAAGQLRIQLNGQWITVSQPAGGSLYFVDLLNYVAIDPKKPNGIPVLLLNEREAAYLDPISDGDRVEIRWSGEKINFPSVF